PTTEIYPLSLHDALPIFEQAVRQGYFVFKIKTGSPGDQTTMLEQDKVRLNDIHEAIRTSTSNNQQQKIYYTMDANGRYQSKEALDRKSTRLNSSHVKISY